MEWAAMGEGAGRGSRAGNRGTILMKDVAKMSRFPSQIEIIMKALKKCHGSRLTSKRKKSNGICMNTSKV